MSLCFSCGRQHRAAHLLEIDLLAALAKIRELENPASVREPTCKNCGKEIEGLGWVHVDTQYGPCDIPSAGRGLQYAEPTSAAPVEPVPPPPQIDWRDMYDRAAKIANTYEQISVMKHGDVVRSLPSLTALLELLSAPVPAPLVAFEMMIREAHQRLTGAVPFTFSTRHGYGYPTDSIDKVTSLLGNVLRLLKSAPVPAPRLSKGELVEIWCKAQYEGRMRELIALYGPESPYVEMYEGGWETCDTPSKESYRRSATYIIDALDKLNAPVPAPRLECPTNHMWLNHNVPGAAEWEPWAAKGYNYCPDCGTSLSPPVGESE